MQQIEQTVDMHWLWLNDRVALSRVHDTLSSLGSGQTLKMAVGFNVLKSVCRSILDEGGRVLRVESMKDEPGYLVFASK